MKTLQPQSALFTLLTCVSLGLSTGPLTPPALAADAYWDANGTDPGAGATPAGIWGTDPFWNLLADGTGTPGPWTAGDTAIFSAGSDATNAFTVTINGTQTAGAMVIKDGAVTLATGTLALGTGSLTLNPGTLLSTDSSLRISASAGATLNINGATLRTTNPGGAGTFYDADFLVTIGPLGATFSHVTPNILNIVQTAMVVTGPGGLTKEGAGVLAIAGTCTYQGSTIINDGEIRIRSTANRLPITTAVIVNSPGVFNLNGVAQRIGSLSGNGLVGIAGTASQTLTVGDDTSTVFSGSLRDIANAGAGGGTNGVGRVLKLGTGTLTLAGVNTYSGTLTISNGTIVAMPDATLCGPICDVVVGGGVIVFSNAAQTILSLAGTNGSVVLDGANTLTVSNSAAKTYGGILAGAGNLVKRNTGTWTLAGNNTYTGSTLIGAGAIQANSPTALGDTATGTEVAAGATLLFDGAANAFTLNEPLRIAGTGAGSFGGAIFVQNSANIVVAAPVTLVGDATIGVSGTGTVLYDNPNAIAAASDQNLTLQGGTISTGGGGTISGVINLGAGKLTKQQGGRWTLAGANVYSGGTAVSNGTLVVANTTGSATGSGDVTVSSGATLAGNGSVAGTVNIQAGANLAPGASVGTLTVGALNLDGTLVVELSKVGAVLSNDRVVSAGGIALNAASCALVVTNTGEALAEGDTFDLWDGAVSGDFASITLPDLGGWLWDTNNLMSSGVIRVVRPPPPVIGTMPQSQDGSFGGEVTLTVTATGAEPLSYQWFFETNAIPGQTNSTLTLSNLICNLRGNYAVVVTDFAGSAVTSAPAVVGLTFTNTAPVILQEPQMLTVVQGETASFSVVATPCDLAYQWYFGTAPLADATNSVLTLTNIQAGNAGNYQVVVSNAAGVVTSAVAVLTFNQYPVANPDDLVIHRDQTAVLSQAKLLANDTDGDNDPISFTGVSPLSTNGGSVTVSNTFVIYQPMPGYEGPDQFTYTINDGRGGTATGTVNVLVTAEPVPPLNQLSPPALVGGVVNLRFAGIPGRSYLLYRSPDLSNWTVISTNTAPPYGLLDLTDTNPLPGSAFYRMGEAR